MNNRTQLFSLLLLVLPLLTHGQTTHRVSVSIDQPETCPVITSHISNAQLKVWPNPVRSSLSIETVFEQVEIQLMDASGKTILIREIQTKRIDISTELLPSGLYFLMVKHRAGLEQVKIIVQ